MRRIALSLLASCALMAGSITNDQIVQMVKAGKADAEIMGMIRKEGLAFTPSGASQTAIRDAGGDLELTAFIFQFSQGHGASPDPRRGGSHDTYDGGASTSRRRSEAASDDPGVSRGSMASAQDHYKARFFMGFGYTSGGDTLASAQYSNGSNITIHAGSGVLFQAGVDWQFTHLVGAQASVGYHVDDTDASNGSISFHRVPFEALVFLYPDQQFRIGAGARKATDASLTSSGAGSIGDYDFSSSTGLVAECEYLSRPTRRGSRYGVSLRYISEKYTLEGEPGAPTFNGNGFGLGIEIYF